MEFGSRHARMFNKYELVEKNYLWIAHTHKHAHIDALKRMAGFVYEMCARVRLRVLGFACATCISSEQEREKDVCGVRILGIDKLK